jgi:hypothetical protein
MQLIGTSRPRAGEASVSSPESPSKEIVKREHGSFGLGYVVVPVIGQQRGWV